MKEGLTIEQIREMKAILEKDIAAKIAGSENETNVQVVNISPEHVEIKMLNRKTVCKSITVNIEIKL